MAQIPHEMEILYSEAKELIDNSEDIKIYSHTDCDGMCSGAILSIILDRLNKPHEIEFVNLDYLNDLPLNHELTIFSDLGSGQPVDKYATENNKILILDHHPPLRDISYKDSKDYTYIEINPNHYGIDGSDEICGGGLCYLLAKTYNFTDLSWIGVLSAVGDMQNAKNGELVGLNTLILDDAIEEGYIELTKKDLNIFGRKTRPLYAALSYFSDVNLPITNNQNETLALLDKLEIPKYTDRKPTTLSDLTHDEKAKLYSALNGMLTTALPGRYAQYISKLLLQDTYEFLMEEEKTFLRDASEFSTAMNACGRNKEYETALEILKGDRFVALDALEAISKRHRYNLARAISKVTEEEETSIIELENLQYFEADGIRAEIVGTVTGMILGYCNWKKPVLGFSKNTEEGYKISLRCSRLLSYDDIHFGNIIREVCKEIGGTGGGHAVACGAYIPIDKKDEFLQIFNDRISNLLKK